jgi:hypothetical protein
MTRNVTLRLDDAVLRQARHLAVQQDRSLSQWLSDLITEAASRSADFAAAKRRALRRLDTGLDLGGKPLTREQAHERR